MSECLLAPREVYCILLKKFGPQGWWPVSKKGSYGPVYRPRKYRLRTEKERFEVCMGAILTQNTSWKNAEIAVENLNRAEITSVDSLSVIKMSRLRGLIRPSGYYNQKSKKLKCFARHIISQAGNITRFFKNSAKGLRQELLSINGVGPETADSIILYAANKPEFVVDSYTRRIGKRLGWYESSDYDAVKDFLIGRLDRSLKVYNEFHALFVELAKRYCKNKPICCGCPLEKRCRSAIRPSMSGSIPACQC